MKSIAPQWIVDNLDETLRFYQQELGFQVEWKGSLFSIIRKHGVSIMLRQLNLRNLKRPNKIPFTQSGWHTEGREAWDAYVWVNNVDELYKSLTEKNVKILKELQITDYGNSEFEIEDNNGYVICFGQIG